MQKKDYRKLISGILQGAFLLVVLLFLLRSFLSTAEYVPYDETEHKMQTEDGFISISYFGASRIGTDINISTKRLEEQLQILYDNGYVTITQQDVIDYYNEGKSIPEKSLFLMFEDGYTGTAIFAEKILEKFNYKATMVTYGGNLDSNDLGLLDAKNLREITKSSFWELGTNGYRIQYINVFDKEENYLGELTPTEFSAKSDIIGRQYNHYLMDYIRDEYGVPKESTPEMIERINTDYALMDDAYIDAVGQLPKLYVIMQGNTGAFANHKKVSDVNETNVRRMFDINFNREGYAQNERDSSIFDLTRMQAQAYWYPNHLLMRVKEDTNKSVDFFEGDLKRSKDWHTVLGAAEHRGDVIALTSEASDVGYITLNKSENYKDFSMSVRLTGNVVGYQSIYLRQADDNYIKVKVGYNEVKVLERVNERTNTIYEREIVPGIDENELKLNDAGDYKLDINLEGNLLTLHINGNYICQVELSVTQRGKIGLESKWIEGEGHRHIYDDVYDGVFEKITVNDLDGGVIYSNNYTSTEKAVNYIKGKFENIINWFIENL